MLDISTVLSLAACGVSCVAAVLSLWYARRTASLEVRHDVDELTAAVERYARVARRDQMRRVRAAAPDMAGVDTTPPPELRAAPPAAPVTKDELRRRFMRVPGGLP